jgi:WD40 repeat protein/serine/threonine protein kinase
MSGNNRLQVLVARWQELSLHGQTATPEEVCRDCPDLLDAFRQHLLQSQRSADLATLPLGNKPVPSTVEATHVWTEGSSAPSLPPPTDPSEGPSPIPGYEILGELGRGGMGVVYKARQVSLQRLVAVKMILAGSHSSEDSQRRFRREVEAIAHLQHPNLVQVHEVGSHEGCPYYSMEYVEGGTLDQKLAGKPQPPEQAAALIETLARTMHALHQQGVVHRDLKPVNILLTADGMPKISDFGLAKRLDDSAGPTLSGEIMGTPSYMAPEQATGESKHVGPATDVYALGAILYEMLTGRPPFHGATPVETITQVASDEPVSPRHLLPRLPIDLETICLKCLEKQLARRYASALALAEDLQRFLAGEPIQARPVTMLERGKKWVHRRPAMAGLVAVSVLAAVVLTVGGILHQLYLSDALHKVEAAAEESRQSLVRLHVSQGAEAMVAGDWFTGLSWFTEALRLDAGHAENELLHRVRIANILRQSPRLVQVLFHDGAVHFAQFSADGSRLVTASDDHTARLWDIATGTAVGAPLRLEGPVLYAVFSPDGRRVVTAGQDGTARIWDTHTAQPVGADVKHGGPVHCAAFSPDGARLATAGDDGVVHIWESSSQAPLTQSLRQARAVSWLAFSPDGSRLVTACADGTAQLWSAPTGQRIAGPLRHAGPVHYAAFDATGKRVVTASADETARVWDTSTGQELTTPFKHHAAVVQATFSPDGTRLLTASDDHSACIWDLRSHDQTVPPMQHTSGVNSACFSADGRCIVTSSDDNTARVWETATGLPLTPLLHSNGTVNWAAFSPNGKWITTVSNDHTVRIWHMAPPAQHARAASSTGLERTLPLEVRWLSADQSRAVTAEGDHSAQVRDVNSGEAIGPLLEHTSKVLHAAFSPDNRRVITASDDNSARIWDASSGELLVRPLMHPSTVRYVAFSSTGRLVLTATEQHRVRLWDAATGEPITPPLRFTGQALAAGFAPDDAQVCLTSTDQTTWTWDLSPAERPTEDLILLAQVLAGNQVDRRRGLLPLAPEALQHTWQLLQSRYPGEPGSLSR